MTTLYGHDAIEYATAHNVTLNKAAAPTEAHRAGLTPTEARAIAAEDAGLIYLDLIYCTGCGQTIVQHIAHWDGGASFCDGCAEATREDDE